MSVMGSHLAGSVAGTHAAERVQQSERKRDEDRRARALREKDEYVVTKVEAAEAARSVKGNGQEEAHEDRAKKAGYQGGYTSRGAHRDAGRPALDVSG
ncbi:MAG: hypothetical protein EA378_10765 [Phycisphaerales bacterium]|nr:MAG: hypothetical protein EA378_10765 [Phycisphaerales bacterium]